MQPLTRHVGWQKCSRPQRRQNASSQLEHHPIGSTISALQLAQQTVPGIANGSELGRCSIIAATAPSPLIVHDYGDLNPA